MAAKTPSNVQTLIQKSCAAGEATRDVAAKLGVHTDTVHKYRHPEPWQQPAGGELAKKFTTRDVRMLKSLAEDLRGVRCPRCDNVVTYLISCPQVACPTCGFQLK